PNDWTLIGPAAPVKTGPEPASPVDLEPFPKSAVAASGSEGRKEPAEVESSGHPPAWHGTLLPQGDGDVWLAAAFADYEKIVAFEKALKHQATGGTLDRDANDRLEVASFAPRSRWLSAVRRLGHDVALTSTAFDWHTNEWCDIAAGKGVLLLAALRGELGPEVFDPFMDVFGRAHAGQPTATSDFLAAAEKAAGRSLAKLLDAWMQSDATRLAPAGCWSIDAFECEPEKALIVYGTRAESQATREAATLLQRKILRRGSNVTVEIKADSEVNDDDLANYHLLLVGRPAVNSVTARSVKSLAASFTDGSFTVKGSTYAHADSAIVVAGDNPFSRRWSVVVYAGLGARATRRAVESLPDRGVPMLPAIVLARGQKPRRICLD
ncbi:MAG TPA: hypothetical protein VGX76_01790, partial [Pirellulales bacterium]|nr:hypothetical protein [Pirellulales bacterium]